MATKIHSAAQFDPFSGDRLCRDIRNDLSESLMLSLESKSLAPSLSVADRYLEMNVKNFMRRYINDRISCYRCVINQLNAIEIAAHEAYVIALLLWDQGLFFEVHEWLESKWYTAHGAQKKIFQALIRAAGTYVHLAYGRDTGAQKMSLKAIETLSIYKKEIPDFLHIELLLKHLKNLSLPPPHLGAQKYVETLKTTSASRS